MPDPDDIDPSPEPQPSPGDGAQPDLEQLSQQWTHLSPENRDAVLASNAMVGKMRQRNRNLDEWLVVGEGVYYMRLEVSQRCGGATEGRQFGRWWRRLAPPELRNYDETTRSRAAWLWENREAVLAWWQTVPENERDRWQHPSTIREHYLQSLPSPLLSRDGAADDDAAEEGEGRRSGRGSWHQAAENRQQLMDETLMALSDAAETQVAAAGDFHHSVVDAVDRLNASVAEAQRRAGLDPLNLTAATAQDILNAITAVVPYETIVTLFGLMGNWLNRHQPVPGNSHDDDQQRDV